LRVTVGVVSFITGFLKLLSVTRGDVPVVGDLLPALSGLLLGGTVLFDRYKERSTVTSNTTQTAEKLLLNNRTAIGLVGIGISAVHFLLPRVLFL
jgi:hypothetical protein